LAEALNVSQNSLREAIKLLNAWGVVVTRHGVGTFVSKGMEGALSFVFQQVSAISDDRGSGREAALRDLHQVRKALEPHIAAIAAHNAEPDHLEQMEAALHSMDEALADTTRYDLPRYLEADLAFHTGLARATGNDLFLMLIYPVSELLQESWRRLAMRTPGAFERAQVFHREILTYVRQKDAEKAQEAMVSHLDQAWKEIRSQLRAEQPTIGEPEVSHRNLD
jgi:GntR family transcriptional repressor for pyruvate dehydrogenase complex